MGSVISFKPYQDDSDKLLQLVRDLRAGTITGAILLTFSASGETRIETVGETPRNPILQLLIDTQ